MARGNELYSHNFGEGGDQLCQESGEDELECLLWVGDHQQDDLLAQGVSPALLVREEEHLQGDDQTGEVYSQLEGIPVFFCKLLPSSYLSQAVRVLSFFLRGEQNHERHHGVH